MKGGRKPNVSQFDKRNFQKGNTHLNEDEQQERAIGKEFDSRNNDTFGAKSIEILRDGTDNDLTAFGNMPHYMTDRE